MGTAITWESLTEGVFLLRGTPEPRAVLRFVGGSLVGAAPQLTYNRFLRSLARRGYWVITAAYAAALDYGAVADLLDARFVRALDQLGLGPDVPVWGLGHSLGSLAQVLISARHPSASRRQQGQILIAYTRKGEEALPVVRGVMATNPFLGPLLGAVDVQAASDMLEKGVEMARQALGRGGSRGQAAAPALRDAAPLLQQMLPLAREVAAGRAEFQPRPSALTAALREGYDEQQTLLIRLGDDAIDETPQLASILAELPGSRSVDFTFRVLRGNHMVPLLPDLGDSTAMNALFPGIRGSRRSASEQWSEADKQQRQIVEAIDKFVKQHPGP